MKRVLIPMLLLITGALFAEPGKPLLLIVTGTAEQGLVSWERELIDGVRMTIDELAVEEITLLRSEGEGGLPAGIAARVFQLARSERAVAATWIEEGPQGFLLHVINLRSGKTARGTVGSPDESDIDEEVALALREMLIDGNMITESSLVESSMVAPATAPPVDDAERPPIHRMHQIATATEPDGSTWHVALVPALFLSSGVVGQLGPKLVTGLSGLGRFHHRSGHSFSIGLVGQLGPVDDPADWRISGWSVGPHLSGGSRLVEWIRFSIGLFVELTASWYRFTTQPTEGEKKRFAFWNLRTGAGLDGCWSIGASTELFVAAGLGYHLLQVDFRSRLDGAVPFATPRLDLRGTIGLAFRIR